MNLLKRRPLRALQVEVTSRCTRKCLVCPRSALSDSWCEGDLDDKLWKALEPDLELAEHLHLQGWGEPLLHPALRDIMQAAHSADCTIGLTTNGDLLSENMDWLLDSELDMITLSIAGDSPTHAELRDGSNLLEILAAASRMAARSREHRNKLLVQASYLLTHDNAGELPAVVELAARANLHEFFVIHLDCQPSRELSERSAFAGEELKEGVQAHLEQAEKVARRSGIKYRGPAHGIRQMLTCALDPIRFSFVGSDGRVGPCVNHLLPVAGEIPVFHDGEVSGRAPVNYGLLGEIRLSELLESEQRQDFTTPFRERVEAERRFFNSLDLQPGSSALKRLDQADEARRATLEANPFPDACQACPKRHGW
jgi:MoaA/NifB/PqqE/SkfB family radical SAM enzyme